MAVRVKHALEFARHRRALGATVWQRENPAPWTNSKAALTQALNEKQ